MGIYDRDWYKDMKKSDPVKDSLYHPKQFRRSKSHDHYAHASNPIRPSGGKARPRSWIVTVGGWLMIGLALYLLLPPLIAKSRGLLTASKPQGAYKCLSVDGRALYTDAECTATQPPARVRTNQPPTQAERSVSHTAHSVAWESAEALILRGGPV